MQTRIEKSVTNEREKKSLTTFEDIITVSPKRDFARMNNIERHTEKEETVSQEHRPMFHTLSDTTESRNKKEI